MTSRQEKQKTGSPGYEKRDIRFVVIVIAWIVLFGVLALVALVSGGLLRLLSKPLAVTTAPNPIENPGLPARPRLELHLPEKLRQLRAAEEAVLNHYGWVDRARGVVHIPIDRAMQDVLEEGLPARKNSPEAAR